MIVCPDCEHTLPGLDVDACERCGWRLDRVAGVPQLLSSADRDSTILGAYRELYERIAQDDLRSSIQLEDHLRIEADRLREAVGDVRGLDVCDVGVGKGMLIERLRDAGARSLTAVDLAQPYLAALAGASPAQLALANAERLPFRERFDVVASSDVLEHVLNVGDFLISVRRALRRGGRFVVRVPFRDNLMTYATLLGYRYPFVHLRAFDRRGLRGLLRDAGFTVGRMSLSGFYASRRRSAIVRHRLLDRRFQSALVRRYGGEGSVTRIDPRVGRLLMRPNVVTAVAERPVDDRLPALLVASGSPAAAQRA